MLRHGQGLRLGTQVKGVRSTVFWTVSIVSGLFIGDGAAGFACVVGDAAKTKLRWCSVAHNGAGIYILVHNQNAIMPPAMPEPLLARENIAARGSPTAGGGGGRETSPPCTRFSGGD